MMDNIFFYKWEGVGASGVDGFFFYTLLYYYFYQCIKKTNISSLLLFTVYTLHIVNIVFDVIFPSGNLHFWLQEIFLLPQFLT